VWKRILAAVLIVAVLAGIGIGAYFIFRPKAARLPDIELNRRYYINELRNGHYRYPTTTGIVEGQQLITLNDKDNSYCIFEQDFKIFRIHFTSNGGVTFNFVMSNVKRSNGSLSATVRHIYDGEIHTYHLTTTHDKIVLKTTIAYRVKISSEEYAPAPIETVHRPGVAVMAFMRAKPSYINEVTG